METAAVKAMKCRSLTVSGRSRRRVERAGKMPHTIDSNSTRYCALHCSAFLPQPNYSRVFVLDLLAYAKGLHFPG